MKVKEGMRLVPSIYHIHSIYSHGTTGAGGANPALQYQRLEDIYVQCSNIPRCLCCLSPILYPHLPADGTHYMLDVSTTQVCTFQNTVSGDGTCSGPGWFMGYYIPLVYLLVVATTSSGSVL